MRGWVIGSLLVGLAAVGCSETAEVQVDVHTDFISGEDFETIRVTVAGTTREIDAPGRDLVGRGERIGGFSVTPGPVVVNVALVESGRVIVERSQSVVVHGTHVVPVWLVRACLEVSCPETGDPANATECESGRCVAPDCAPDDPTCATFCTLDAECDPAPVSCLRTECRMGRCLDVEVAGACLPEEYCDAALGCRMRTTPLEDAGVPLEVGASCTTDGECNDGNVCTRDTCVAGRCVLEPMSSSCDDGVFCNGADTCSGGACVHTGSPCGGASCTEAMHACGACASVADCPSPMNGPWGACGYPDGCTANGTRSRDVTRFSCTGGLCVGAAMPETDTLACERTTEGSACGTTSYGPLEPCTSSVVCSETGTARRSATDYVCVSGACMPRERAETTACSRSTTGSPCDDGVFCNGGDVCAAGTCTSHAGPPCGALTCDEPGRRCAGCATSMDCPATTYGAWSACSYGSFCSENGSRARSVTSYACSAGSCIPTTNVETDGGSACNRVTNDMECDAREYGPWSGCGYMSDCATSGSRIRNVIRYGCGAGSCRPTMGTETDVPGCERSTNGNECDGGSTVGSWGACTGSDICGLTGSHMRPRRDLRCMDGACSAGPEYDEMESCPRDTDGIICSSSSCEYTVCANGGCTLYGGTTCSGGQICCDGSYCDYTCVPVP